MEEAQIRMDCYEMAFNAGGTLSANRVADKDLAEKFVAFCQGSEERLRALRLAVSQANTRAKLDSVMESANDILAFVSPPEAAPKASKSPRHRRKQK